MGAFVRIPLPFTPVPLTLQTFFVLLSAALLCGRLGIIAQFSYLLLGISGLPIFTGALCGLSYLFSPTAGYLFGFFAATIFIAFFLKGSKAEFFSVFTIFTVADIIILSCGTIWLKLILGITLFKALLIGFAPFVLGDLVKISLAALIFLKLGPRLRKVL
jgi:biotin transport system substrate-specific component